MFNIAGTVNQCVFFVGLAIFWFHCGWFILIVIKKHMNEQIQ